MSHNRLLERRGSPGEVECIQDVGVSRCMRGEGGGWESRSHLQNLEQLYKEGSFTGGVFLHRALACLLSLRDVSLPHR